MHKPWRKGRMTREGIALLRRMLYMADLALLREVKSSPSAAG
jgi:hypothetical protein